MRTTNKSRSVWVFWVFFPLLVFLASILFALAAQGFSPEKTFTLGLGFLLIAVMGGLFSSLAAFHWSHSRPSDKITLSKVSFFLHGSICVVALLALLFL